MARARTRYCAYDSTWSRGTDCSPERRRTMSSGACSTCRTPGPVIPRASVRSNTSLSAFSRACRLPPLARYARSEEHTSELQSRLHLVCRLLLEKYSTMFNLHSIWLFASPRIFRSFDPSADRSLPTPHLCFTLTSLTSWRRDKVCQTLQLGNADP